ncbi:MAG: prephenate dehydrogenase/arogenate dehydrogenase family protein [Clostridia bacterium]|nr:prephenate dehydrogenase/arogenate dehydrogenase family protein [Clostridia bacterium]
MNVGVIGLGLIGGSIAKAISKNTSHTAFGYDKSDSVLYKAKLVGAISEELSLKNPSNCDIIILALYPADTIEVFEKIAPELKEGTIVIDCSGVKRNICDTIRPIAQKNNVIFIGGHPMAGIERSGLEYSFADMFKDAPMILTPYSDTGISTLYKVKELFLDMGFKSITIKSPDEHDRIIAYTSQLAHILSSAYIKSPTATSYEGMSAGSFKDMTRVAYLNENMWTELFLENKDNLVFEIETLIKNLTDYKEVINSGDRESLNLLLKEGRIKKESI